jgi:GAF domain-containing protein
MRDLSFFETAVEAVSFGLVTALKALPSLAGLALLRDTAQGGYVVVYAQGPRASSVVRARIEEDDSLLGLSLIRGGPTTIEYGTAQPPPDRHALFGDPWSALIAPIQLADRCIGALELVDPLDGRPLGESARHGLATIAHHLADFIRGLGPEIEVCNAFAPEQVGLSD